MGRQAARRVQRAPLLRLAFQFRALGRPLRQFSVRLPFAMAEAAQILHIGRLRVLGR